MFFEKGVLKICSKFTGEHPCRSVISIKLLCNFIEIILLHGFCPVNLLHIFRTPFPRNTSGWLLLHLLSTLIVSSLISSSRNYFGNCQKQVFKYSKFQLFFSHSIIPCSTFYVLLKRSQFRFFCLFYFHSRSVADREKIRGPSFYASVSFICLTNVIMCMNRINRN